MEGESKIIMGGQESWFNIKKIGRKLFDRCPGRAGHLKLKDTSKLSLDLDVRREEGSVPRKRHCG